MIEFKVFKESDLTMEGTVRLALDQIEDKKYTAYLLDVGYKEEQIYKYGIAFSGKEALIGKR